MRVNLALMNVKGSLAGRKTSSGGALQTLGTGLCQGRVPRLAELPEQGTGGGNAASPSSRGLGLLIEGASGGKSQARLAWRCQECRDCHPAPGAPAQPCPAQPEAAAPALPLQREMFTQSPAFLQQLESRLKCRKHDIICLLPAQDRLAPL